MEARNPFCRMTYRAFEGAGAKTCALHLRAAVVYWGKSGEREYIFMAEIFEVIMVVCFGLSWPISIHKSWVSRTAKGKSLVFELFLIVGYVFGIASKFVSGRINYVVIFYCINLVAVSIDASLYFRNRRLDRLAEQKV